MIFCKFGGITRETASPNRGVALELTINFTTMEYAEHLRKIFPDLTLVPEDLLLLETFQISYLPDRVPSKEFAVLLHENPVVHRFLLAKHPPIKEYLDGIMKKRFAINNDITVNRFCQKVLWEIGEMIVYSKCPKLFDSNTQLPWQLKEILPVTELSGKTIVDAGAGTGRISFLVAELAKTVFAVEPNSSMRQFIREKTHDQKLGNKVFTMDGFLHQLPFTDNSIDILISSNAIGWHLEQELAEIERVLKPNGKAIHLFLAYNLETELHHHDTLVSTNWNYSQTKFEDYKGLKLKYSKEV